MADGRVELEVTADTSKAEKEIDSVGDSAKKAGKDAESAGGGAFKKVEKGANSAAGEADSLGSAAKQAGNDAEGAGNGSFKKVEKGAEDAETAVDSLKGAMAGIGAGFGVGATVAGVSELAATSAEAQTYMSRLEASASENNVSAQAMSDTYSGLVGVLGETDRSVETAGNMFALCGDNQDKLQQMTTALTGAYSQFGDGLPIEGLAEAANETAKVGTVTGSFADALNWTNTSVETFGDSMDGNVAAQDAWYAAIDAGMSKEDAFNAALAACSDEGERQELVLQALNAAYGDAGAAYEENNAALIAYNQSQDALASSMAGMGSAFMPLVTNATNLASTLMDQLVPAVEAFANGDYEGGAEAISGLVTSVISGIGSALPGIIEAAGGIAAAVIEGILSGLANGDVVASLSETLVSLFSMLGEVVPQIAETIATYVPQIIVGLVTSLIENAPALIQGFVQLFTTLIQAIPQIVAVLVPQIPVLIGQLAMAIITNAPLILSAAVQAFMTLVTALAQAGGQLLSQLPAILGNLLSSVGSWAGSLGAQAIQAGSQFLNGIIQFFTQLPGSALGLLNQVISNVGSFVGQMASGAIQAGSQFLSNIVNELGKIPGRVLSIGGDIVQGLVDGITGAASKVTDALTGLASDALNAAKNFLGIASPSKVFRREVGRWIPAGAALGVEDEAEEFQRAIDDVFAYRPSLSARATWAPVIGAPAERPIEQTVIFQQPVQTPAQMAREMRMYGRYGLGAVV